MGSAYDYAKDHAGEIGGDLLSGGMYSGYKALTGQGGIYSDVNKAIGNPLGALAPASTAGVQQAAGDAQNIQNQFLQQYQNLQPGQAPTMNPAFIAQAAQMSNATANAAAPVSAAQAQAAQINAGQANQDRAAQLALAGNLAGTISGQGPSVAQLQQNQALQRLASQQMGFAAMAGRGGNQALAARTAMQQASQLGASQAGANALTRANEVATAQGQLGNVLSGVAGNDIGMATNQAGLTQQAGLTNAQLQQQATLQNQSNQQNVNLQNAQFQQSAMAQNAQQAQAQNLANQQAAQQAAANNQTSQLQTRSQDISQQQNLGALTNQANSNQVNAQVGALNAQTAQKQQTGNMIGTGLTALALSDRRLKTNIRQAPEHELHEAMASMRPTSFAYKGGAPKVGILAQDVEKSRVGKSLVRETAHGKAIDLPSAAGALMAMVGDLHRRVSAVEGKKKA